MAELELLNRVRGDLEKAIRADLRWLAHQLNQDQVAFLNDDDHDDIINDRSTSSQISKAGVIVSALYRRVEGDHTDLKVFVDILKKKPQLFKHAIKLLDGDTHGEPQRSYPPTAGIYTSSRPEEPPQAGFSPPYVTPRQSHQSAAHQSAATGSKFGGSDFLRLDAVDNSELDREDDFADVLEAVQSLASSWEKLAIKLRLHSSRIDVIGKDYHGDSEKCLNEVVKEFLKKNYNSQKLGHPSWKLLVWAVASIDEGQAEVIANRHRDPRIVAAIYPVPPSQVTGIRVQQSAAGGYYSNPPSAMEPFGTAVHPTPQAMEQPIGAAAVSPAPAMQTAAQLPVLRNEATLPLLTIIKWTDGRGVNHTLRLLEGMAIKWKEIGSLADIPGTKLSIYEKKHMRDSEDCMRDVVADWIMMCSEKYPATWEGLIKLLQDARMDHLVAELLQAAADRNSTINT